MCGGALLTKEKERRGDHNPFTLSLADTELTYMVILCCKCCTDQLSPSLNKENRKPLGRTLALSIVTPLASAGREDVVCRLCRCCVSLFHFLASLSRLMGFSSCLTNPSATIIHNTHCKLACGYF